MADRFDLDAIDADDALLDLLAAGGESARMAGEHDPAVALLAELRLAVEVEDELPVEKIDDPETFLARCAALNPITDPFARKMATRGLAFGVAAVAALSVSGVAAAVNGDPLSPYEKVIEKMVDAVRPQTSFPKEDLDGMPVVDKSKIVKVAKDFQKKAQEERAKQDNTDSGIDQEPAASKVPLTPPLLQPPKEQPLAIPLIPDEQVAQVKPQEPTKTVTDPKSDQGKDPAKTDPTTPAQPTTDPTTQPTEQPTQPAEPPATTTPPSTDPSTPPATEPTGDPTSAPTTPANTETGTGTGDQTTAPTGDGGNGSNDTHSTDTTTPGSDQTSTGNGSTDGSGSTDPVGQLPSSDNSHDAPATDTPATDVPADSVGQVVESLAKAVLPTPSGQAMELQSAERFFGKQKGVGKHSAETAVTGSVRKHYAKGKHSTGQYVEGKHAAIERTHGSTADEPILTILGIVNRPTN
ncbi:hypothetical protein AB0E69_04120 [Kribbella sp. NPDC026611]|uniref:hypothetical protein n=1 Tax=Kribbella sp. NPDC026611 TaxID=3154911 RepID=UPI003408346F